jgi:hypothetical protein
MALIFTRFFFSSEILKSLFTFVAQLKFMKIYLRKNFLILGLAFFSACSSDVKKNQGDSNTIDPSVVNNPATASSGEKTTGNIPVFKFNEMSHDFGTILQGEKTSHAFRFTNSGKSDLVIRTASGSCGCTVPEYPKDPVAPGKEGVINVTFNSEGKEGKQNKTVTIIANTIPNSTVLTITGEVKKPEEK